MESKFDTKKFIIGRSSLFLKTYYDSLGHVIDKNDCYNVINSLMNSLDSDKFDCILSSKKGKQRLSVINLITKKSVFRIQDNKTREFMYLRHLLHGYKRSESKYEFLKKFMNAHISMDMVIQKLKQEWARPELTG